MKKKPVKRKTKTKKKYRKNPSLAIVSNPVESGRRIQKRDNLATGHVMSDRVVEIRYVHNEDGKAYKHTFGLDVQMIALRDGSILLSHPRKPLWGNYP